MTSGLVCLNLLLLLAALPVVCVALYLLLLALAACMHPGRRRIDGLFPGIRMARTRFLVLIPAHNEELLLGGVLEQLKGHTYDAARVQVVVVADNCTDQTAAVARAQGVVVLERTDLQNRGKGQALNWAMRTCLPSWPDPFDAVVILDADSTVNPDFFWFLNEQLAAGHEALQAYYGVQNPQEHWRTSLLTASLAAFHFLRPLGRDQLGLPCGLKGNGMCFARRLALEYGYPAFSVVEDVELALFLLRQGIRVKFVPGAHVLGQMAVSAQAAGTQRARWEGGRLALIRTQAWPLLKEGIHGRDAAKVDGALDLLIPPFALLVACTALPAVGLMALWAAGHHVIWGGVVVLWCGAWLLEAVYVLAALQLIQAPAVIYWRLLAAPLFILWKLGVYSRMALAAKRGKSGEWVRTGRQAMSGKK